MNAFALLLAAAMLVPTGGLQLTSDELTIDPSTHVATARGHVHAEGTTVDVTCEEAKATYGAPAPGQPRQVEHLDATGNVHLVRKLDGLVADAREATWDRASELSVLSGEPVVRRGGDVLRGTRIVVHLASDAYEIDLPQVTLARPGREAARVTSQHLSVTGGGARALFERNVVLHQGDLAATSDRLDASLDESGVEAKALSRLVLAGHVEISRGAMRAHAQNADYDASTGDLVLTGTPRVESGTEELTGERIVVNGATGIAHVERATAHVRSGR